jgi:hypothetical protein
VNNLRYLWRHQYGRLAVLALVVGVVGLTAHVWLGFLLVGALVLPRSVTSARQTPTDRTPRRSKHRNTTRHYE